VRLRLREWRLRRFLSQRELAERSGVRQPTIARLEVGAQRPRPKTVRVLAKALGIEPGELVEWEAGELD
jgi:transcriptional regulator with XRE-family HTH domain